MTECRNMAVLSQVMSLGIWAVVCSSIILVEGYPSGAPASACVTMTPGHVGFSPDANPPPFEVLPETGVYGPNSTVVVILSTPCGGETFEGFLLEARRADVGLDRDEPIGTFEHIPESQYVANCGNGRQAVTHIDKTPKSQLSFIWMAPEQPTGHIVFATTFAANKSRYWVKVYSEVVRDETLATGPDVGGETYPTPSTCSVNPTQPTGPQLPEDPQCDVTKWCFKNCQDNSCSFLVTWKNSTDYTHGVEFELAAPVDRTTNTWMAIGFSDDRKMGNDTVVECVSFNDEINIYTSYNTLIPRLDNERNENPHPSDGVHSLNSSSLIDGIFRCSFVVVTKELSYINLVPSHYLLFSAGNTATFKDTKLIHEVDQGRFPPISENKIYFMGIPQNSTVQPNSSAALYIEHTRLVFCLFLTLLLGRYVIQ